jgi:predicted GNAT family acetyltransferase
MPHTITRQAEGSGGVFVLDDGGQRVGTLDYSDLDAGTFAIDFVEVTPARRGAGLGRELVGAAVAWARESGRGVVARCPYAAAVIARTPEFQDVRKA